MPKYNEFEKELEQFAQKVKIYNVNVNQSGTWLFLATLGCWSINDLGMRGAAILCTFIIFSHQLFTGIGSFKLFSTDLNDMERRITESELDIKSQKALRLDILELKSKQLSLSRIFLHMPAYYLSFLFLGTSIVFWMGYFA